MDTGLAAKRYATALLRYSYETGGSKEVFTQVMALVKSLAFLPQLRSLLDNPVSVNDARKYALLIEAAGGEDKVRDELKRFLKLVISHRRTHMLTRILISYLAQYRKAEGMKIGRLVTAVPDPELTEKLVRLVHEKTGDTAEFVTKVDPALIGGFILEIDGYRMDASTATQIKRIRRQFKEKNRRIV